MGRTTTEADSAPMSRTIGGKAYAPVCRLTVNGFVVNGANPTALTVTRYEPKRTPLKLNLPVASDVDVSMSVPSLRVSSASAPARAVPVTSLTTPVTLVAVSCAATHAARARRRATRTATLGLSLLKILYISKCPTLRTRSRAVVDVVLILALSVHQRTANRSK